MNYKYGWWSSECAARWGYCIYRKPDGGQLLITSVSRHYNHSGTYWRDVYFCGLVLDNGFICRADAPPEIVPFLAPEAVPVPDWACKEPAIINPLYRKVFIDVEL
jgi:hypothetical protein